jgi:DNA processing protein
VEGRRVSACDACLRRAALLQLLAGRIGSLLKRPERRAARLLALPDLELIDAVAADGRDTALRLLETFDPAAARERTRAAGVEAFCAHDEAFPAGLENLTDPPAVLFAKGRPGRLVELASEPMVAIVGARRGSTYGKEVAHALGRALGAAGVTVVSGLAIGVDGAAHRGALAARGGAIAVLASGADRVYPLSHRRLYNEVCSTGVVVSEMPPGTPPFRWAFPARNRIMAALATLTVVVEAAEGSGSLITATFAQELGRDVGVVPGLVTSRKAAGSNRLLHEGACPIRDARDVLDLVYGVGHVPDAQRDEIVLEPALRRVLDGVEMREELGPFTGLPAGDVRAALGRLETLGLVRRDGLGSYERTAS